jgi:hypothetical protein
MLLGICYLYLPWLYRRNPARVAEISRVHLDDEPLAETELVSQRTAAK